MFDVVRRRIDCLDSLYAVRPHALAAAVLKSAFDKHGVHGQDIFDVLI